ncbi:MAG: hypothetical protein N7Q72_02600 [Spiroplasma sp. Tabriz.8]|nr:hypothetical protein [Candidatus Regiella insecticola]MCZ8632135.1 hypothetical protein [Spiroplasma sp. Tabriz.8]
MKLEGGECVLKESYNEIVKQKNNNNNNNNNNNLIKKLNTSLTFKYA